VHPPEPDASTKRDVDIAAGLRWPLEQPGWLGTCLLVGVCGLVPVLGWLVFFGWQRRIFDRLRAGEADGLPGCEPLADAAYGLRPFLATCAAAVIVVAPPALIQAALLEAIPGLVVAHGGSSMALELLTLGAAMAAVLAAIVLFLVYQCELLRLILRGRWVPVAPVASARAIRSNVVSYALLTVGVHIAYGIVGAAGALALGVGLLVTAPLSGAMAAHLLAQWDSEVG